MKSAHDRRSLFCSPPSEPLQQLTPDTGVTPDLRHKQPRVHTAQRDAAQPARRYRTFARHRRLICILITTESAVKQSCVFADIFYICCFSLVKSINQSPGDFHGSSQDQHSDEAVPLNLAEMCQMATSPETWPPLQLINQSLLFVRPKVDQRAGQLSLPHVGITKTERNETKA